SGVVGFKSAIHFPPAMLFSKRIKSSETNLLAKKANCRNWTWTRKSGSWCALDGIGNIHTNRMAGSRKLGDQEKAGEGAKTAQLFLPMTWRTVICPFLWPGTSGKP